MSRPCQAGQRSDSLYIRILKRIRSRKPARQTAPWPNTYPAALELLERRVLMNGSTVAPDKPDDPPTTTAIDSIGYGTQADGMPVADAQGPGISTATAFASCRGADVEDAVAANPAPVVESMSVVADKGLSLTAAFVVHPVNGNPLTYSVVNGPSSGTVSIDNAKGTFTYIPNRNALRGTDSFLFKANDGVADSNIGMVTITIQEYLANAPIGEAKGIHPGRVAWVYDPAAAKWDGSTGY